MKRSLLLFLLALSLLLIAGCDAEVGDDDDDSSGDDDSAGDDDDSAADDDDGTELPVDGDGDNYLDEVDCDDGDPAIHPGADELCDSIDNDCDGAVDESDAQDAPTWYRDADGDGYGVDSSSSASCNQPHGYSAYAGDCDDNEPSYHPGAAESDCSDPNDYNCDGQVMYADSDLDGEAACEDCDDNNSTVNSAATETCNDVDDDCDGLIDEAGATGESIWYLDADGDGYGRTTLSQVGCEQQAGYVANSDDCDDLDASSYPGGSEVCDGADNNCTGGVDEGVQSTFYADSDGDGYGDSSTQLVACFLPAGASANALDCDDMQPSVHPGGIELCDGLDNDCDSFVDDSALDATTWFVDSDGDGYGDPLTGTSSCSVIADRVSNGLDCNDGDGDNYPGNSEICDGQDNDCSGNADFSNSQGDELSDVDGDQYIACQDCDDDDSDNFPGNTETCDGDDENCDGSVDEGFDADGDGITSCGADGIIGTADDDCDNATPGSQQDGTSALCAATSCKAILDLGSSPADGLYWVNPDGGGAFQVYCDMNADGGGWTLTAVALYGNHGAAGWNDEAGLNIADATNLNAHWHLASDLMNSLAVAGEYRANCFNSNNNYNRYWFGVSDYNWASLTSAAESWDSYQRDGSSYPTSWSGGHFGLVSGANETDTVITAHNGHQWACGGATAPGGEGYTGRPGGVSSFRLWAK